MLGFADGLTQDREIGQPGLLGNRQREVFQLPQDLGCLQDDPLEITFLAP
jgi:hypothetical protein